METEWEERSSLLPHYVVQSPGRLVVQANDERWRANLVSRVTLAKLKQGLPDRMESSGWRMTGRFY